MATISHLLLVVFLSVFFSICHTAPTSAAGPTVTVDSGLVVGTATSLSGASASVTKYLGIPFAASPTRFAPAARPTSWKTPLDATKYGPACLQQFNYPEASRNRTIAFFNTPPPSAGESEDCLNLNVYVPGTPGKNKTVMVWIYVSLRLDGHGFFQFCVCSTNTTETIGRRFDFWLQLPASIRWDRVCSKPGCHHRLY